jgi:hypothetical protein
MDIAICEKHNIPLLTSPTGVGYCMICIEELIKIHKGEADDIYNKLRSSLSTSVVEKLDGAIKQSLSMKGQDSEEMAVLRFVAAKALRSGKTIDEVVDAIIDADSIESLEE